MAKKNHPIRVQQHGRSCGHCCGHPLVMSAQRRALLVGFALLGLIALADLIVLGC
jgi:hypothetical protein